MEIKVNDFGEKGYQEWVLRSFSFWEYSTGCYSDSPPMIKSQDAAEIQKLSFFALMDCI